MKINNLIAVATIVFISGYSHQITPADKMLDHSNETKALANDWNEGERLIVEGKENQNKGNMLITKGQNQITEGNSLIRAGNENITSGNKLLNIAHDQVARGLLIKQKSEVIFKEKKF